jgi:hypothetical protein
VQNINIPFMGFIFLFWDILYITTFHVIFDFQ